MAGRGEAWSGSAGRARQGRARRGRHGAVQQAGLGRARRGNAGLAIAKRLKGMPWRYISTDNERKDNLKMNIANIFGRKPCADFNLAWEMVAAVCDALAYGFNTAYSFPPFRMGGTK